MTKREAKAVEIMRKHTPFGYSDKEMLSTPIAVIALECMDWMAQECVNELHNAVEIIDRSDPYPPEVKFDKLVILNAGKEEA